MEPVLVSHSHHGMPRFLAGGGEMGAYIGRYPWQQTTLGAMEQWPQALCTTLGILLHSKFPMFLFWGPEAICFYNDAYRPSLGVEGKHPGAIGKRGAEVWPEIWDLIQPQIDHVLGGGEATWFEDQLVPIYRNGALEEVYWTYSYSPVLDETGRPAGVFVTCTETTEKTRSLQQLRRSEQELKESEARFRGSFENVAVGMAHVSLEGRWLLVNERLAQIVGYSREELLTKDFQSITHPDDIEGDWQLARSLAAGEIDHYALEKRYIHKNGSTVWVNITVAAHRNAQQEPEYFIATVEEIGKRHEAIEALKENKERLQAALNASQTGTFRWNIQTNELYWDENLDRLFGLPPGKTLQTLDNFIAHVHPEDQASVILHCRLCAETAVDFDLEFRVVWPDGSIHWLHDKGKTYVDAQGHPAYMTGACLDITDQRQAEAALQESEQQLRQISDFMPQMVWSTDAQGFHDFYNKRWYEFTGMTYEQTKGEGWSHLLHPEDFERTRNVWENCLRTGALYEIEYRMRRSDGEYRWLLARALPLRNEEGNVIRWFGTCTDIHDQRSIAEKLESLVEDRTRALQRSNEDLQQFAHVASHDLKEPVRKIRTFLSRFQDEQGETLTPKGRLYIDKVEHSARRITDMIDGVLRYSSLDADEEGMELVQLPEILQNIHADLELIFEQKEAQLELGLLPAIVGSPLLVQQLFYNLINNSLKFAHAERPLLVRVYEGGAEWQQAGFVAIVLEDNGIGFPAEAASKIFKTFTRLHSKDRYEGTGLGLALCKKIIERHGGHIVAEGREGLGARFVLYFPVKDLEQN